MPVHAPRLMKWLNHLLPTKPQHIHRPALRTVYGHEIQLSLQDNGLIILDNNGIKLAQSIVGSSLCFGRITDNTMIMACNDISSK